MARRGEHKNKKKKNEKGNLRISDSADLMA